MNKVIIHNLTPFASGGNRRCYRHPDNNNLCLKVEHQGRTDYLWRAAPLYKRLLGRSGFDDNQRERKGYQQPALRDPDSPIWRHVARWYGWQETDQGTANVTEFISDPNDEPAPTLETIIKRREFDADTYTAVERLATAIMNHGLLTKNLLPHNLVRNIEGEFVLIDGLGAPDFFGLLRYSRLYRDRYIRRRVKKMWHRIQWELEGRVSEWRVYEKIRHTKSALLENIARQAKPRVIITTQAFPPERGGIQNYVFNLATELKRTGYDTSVYTDAPEHPDASSFDRQQAFFVRRFGGIKALRRRIKAKHIANRLPVNPSPTVIICDSWKSLEHLKTNHNANHTILCLAHGMEFPAYCNIDKQRRITNSLDKADYILANSVFTAGRATPYVSDTTRIQVLNPGVARPDEITRDDTAWANALIGSYRHRLITVGRIEARKGQDRMLQLLPHLIEKFPSLVYTIVGSGPDEQKLQSAIATAGLDQHVKFTGALSQGKKNALLQLSTIFTMPVRESGSSIEGFGIAYLEAGLYGLPCIAGKAGGAADAVLDGITGILVDGDDIGDIERGLMLLLSNNDRCKEMGTAAKQRAISQFLWPVVATQLTERFFPRHRIPI